MNLALWLLIVLGPFLAVGAVGLPAFLQWPVPASTRPRSPRPVFAGAPYPAGGARW
ncbi:hypothetical protein Q0Z83_059790 [Actinoplanes sichuanensis]|uniref:Uncharacterized protein n=1 Tax=Actinoplanes sichuanensis TaxID=512349 RepID=A0ABW4A651_9ACTN|nr:hypothetical protein [Actinoplanes sichuanensis]BEL07788.1 hypothetical protein Q0Z83_059790 [Actinoplanes sichuanensis]